MLYPLSYEGDGGADPESTAGYRLGMPAVPASVIGI